MPSRSTPQATQASQPQQKQPVVVRVPTCVICLRRLKNLDKITDGVEVDRIQISRSYTGSSTVEAVGDTLGSTADGGVTIRCGVCYLYETAILRKSSFLASPPPVSSSEDAKELSTSTALSMDSTVDVCHTDPQTAVPVATKEDQYSISNVAEMYNSTVCGVKHLSTRCNACGLSNNIWICLTCAYSGCGRYCKQHAEQHFVEHTRGLHHLSIELASGRIWNY